MWMETLQFPLSQQWYLLYPTLFLICYMWCVYLSGISFKQIQQADGFPAIERVGIPGAHRGLLRDETVFEYIRKWLGLQQQSNTTRVNVKTSKVVDVGLG